MIDLIRHGHRGAWKAHEAADVACHVTWQAVLARKSMDFHRSADDAVLFELGFVLGKLCQPNIKPVAVDVLDECVPRLRDMRSVRTHRASPMCEAKAEEQLQEVIPTWDTSWSCSSNATRVEDGFMLTDTGVEELLNHRLRSNPRTRIRCVREVRSILLLLR